MTGAISRAHARFEEGRRRPVIIFIVGAAQAGEDRGEKPKRKIEQKEHQNLIQSMKKSSTTVLRFHGGTMVSSQHKGKLSKAIEKATENREVVEAIGVPMVRGPWYDASLAVGHRGDLYHAHFQYLGHRGQEFFNLRPFGMEAFREENNTWKMELQNMPLVSRNVHDSNVQRWAG